MIIDPGSETSKSQTADGTAQPQIENRKSEIVNTRKGIGGPKTEEGKRRVSTNALKHGLSATSEQAMEALEQTIGCSYAETLDRMRIYLKPMDPVEDVLVRRIARSTWRMMVTEKAENTVLSRRPDHIRVGKSYQAVIHTERFIDVHLHRAIAALQNKRGRECDKTQNKLNTPSIHEGISR
jgi:hypothetical protein